MRSSRSSCRSNFSSSSYSLASTSLSNRLETIFKKASELCTLCDIEACVIHYGPDGELKTWPKEQEKVRDIALRYSQLDEAVRRKKNVNLYEFLKKTKGKTNLKKRKTSLKNLTGLKYPISDHHSPDQISQLIQSLELNVSKFQERLQGLETEWMMHEFRFPSISDSHHTTYPNYLNNNSSKEIPSQRAIQQSWVYPTIPDTNQYNSQSHNTAALLASSDILSHIATRQNLIPSPVNEHTSFTDSAAVYFASQMLGVPYDIARNSGTGDALFLRNSEIGDALFLSNNENNYFNNLTGALSHEFTNVRSTVMEEETTVSEMPATSYSTNN